MITIRLTFPAGRYHATPWGRHVNEGVPEWPPSPYRLVRGLYDVWQRKCSDLPESEVQTVLEALAGIPPRFTLPQAVATHTRSYLNANSKDPSDKNLVFDSFLVFDKPHACFATWLDVDLPANLRATLNRLLTNMNYLGRSESWVQAEIWDGAVDGDYVCDTVAATDVEGELHSVACVVPRAEYEGAARWLDALTFSTTNLMKERASSPPLLRPVRYVRPEGAILTDAPRRVTRRVASVQAVLLGLDATVLPLVTATLEIAEQIRVRLMGAHRRINDGNESLVSPLFSGKTQDGSKRLDHGHLYILPLGNHMGRIDRVLLLSRLTAFAQDELEAVRGVRQLYQRDGRPGVRCVITWQGSCEASPVRELSRTVVSATPFIPPRNWRKGRDFARFVESEVRRECANHGLGAEPLKVEPLSAMPGLFDLVEYRRNRKEDPVRPGFSLKLTFAEPVLAPFTIGYGAHFGLGQFRPAAQA